MSLLSGPITASMIEAGKVDCGVYVWCCSLCACAQWLTADESYVCLRTMAYCRWKLGALVHQVVYVRQFSSCMSMFDIAWQVGALDFVVFVAIAQHDENLFSRAQGLAVRHSSFVVANRCCCCHRRWATRYKNAGRSHPRPCWWHLLSSLLLLLLSPLLHDAIWKCWALVPEALLLTLVVITAVVVVGAIAQHDVYTSVACPEDLVTNISCCCCHN